MKPWRVQSSRTLVERRWLTVREQRIELPHGGTIDEFHLIEGPDWACAVAVTDEGGVVFVDQYRHGAGRASRELPAGVIDEGETAEQAAIRELREETGFVADRWAPLFAGSPEPARNRSRAHFFVGTGARRVTDQALDASESIATVVLTPEEIVAAIDDGTILHAAHVAAILLAARRGLLSLPTPQR
jgi:8-oxo-dGTP pyrophosphatase MutT (NUDIX family)